MKFKGVTITVNYPDDTVEAAVPSEMTLEQLIMAIQELADTEPDMTSLVIAAATER